MDKQGTRDYWPTLAWRSSVPEAQGVDSEGLAKALLFIKEQGLNLHSLLIQRHGYVVLDAYFHPYTPGVRHDIASATKSFTSTLIGIALDRGYISSVDQPVLDFFQGRRVANLSARKNAMTLEHLLTMTSGFDSRDSESEITTRQLVASSDRVQFMLDLPMSDEPGTRFNYANGVSHLLSAIVSQVTGMSAFDFAKTQLFGPLGITDVVWPSDAHGTTVGWGDLRLTPPDMAKLGYLFLNGGLWDGKQVVSREWVATATRVHVPPSPGSPLAESYGYQWWIIAPGIYNAAGRGGQRILIAQDMDLVIVTTASIDRDNAGKLKPILESCILPAINSRGALPENPSGVSSLGFLLDQAGQASSMPEHVAPLPLTAHRMSGKTFVMEPNCARIRSLSLTFGGQDVALVEVDLRGACIRAPAGLDNVYRVTSNAEAGLVALMGRWESDGVFLLRLRQVSLINDITMELTFEGDSVIVRLHEATGPFDTTICGRLQP